MTGHSVDQRETCHDCGDYLEDDELVHQISFAFWDVENNSFEKDEPTKEKYCRECWNDIRPSKQGAEFEIDTIEELWDILASSNGRLVADFKAISVGARPFIRVVGGEPEVAVVKMRRRAPDVVQAYTSFEQKDREWFNETVESYLDGDLPPIVYLRNSDNTPFDSVHDREEGQSQIEEFA